MHLIGFYYKNIKTITKGLERYDVTSANCRGTGFTQLRENDFCNFHFFVANAFIFSCEVLCLRARVGTFR